MGVQDQQRRRYRPAARDETDRTAVRTRLTTFFSRPESHDLRPMPAPGRESRIGPPDRPPAGIPRNPCGPPRARSPAVTLSPLKPLALALAVTVALAACQARTSTRLDSSRLVTSYAVF